MTYALKNSKRKGRATGQENVVSQRKLVAFQTMSAISRVLRTPLARMVEQLDALQVSEAKSDEIERPESSAAKLAFAKATAERIPEIMNDASFLVELIDSLNELCVPPRRGTLREFEPGRLVRESVSALSMHFTQSQVVPMVLISPELPATIFGDVISTERLIKCLVMYVLRSQSSRALRVECRLKTEPTQGAHCLVIEVCDKHDTDLPPKAVYEPEASHSSVAGVQSSNATVRRSTDATQLTLFIVRRILRPMGGQLRIYDQPRQGVRILATLPLEESRIDETTVKAPRASADWSARPRTHGPSHRTTIKLRGQNAARHDRDPRYRAIIDNYVRNLPKLFFELRKAASADQFDVVQRHALRLTGSGELFGFPDLTLAAQELFETVARRPTRDEVMPYIDGLERLITDVCQANDSQAPVLARIAAR